MPDLFRHPRFREVADRIPAARWMPGRARHDDRAWAVSAAGSAEVTLLREIRDSLRGVGGERRTPTVMPDLFRHPRLREVADRIPAARWMPGRARYDDLAWVAPVPDRVEVILLREIRDSLRE